MAEVTYFGDLPFPPGSKEDPLSMQLLGWHLIRADKENQTIRVG
jgi:hypothetical protein